MCLAIPGRIIKINGEEAVVDYETEKRRVNISMTDAKVGDYVFVQNMFAIQKIPEKEALEALRLWKKMMK